MSWFSNECFKNDFYICMSVLLACMCITWVQEHSEPRKCIRCGPGVTDGCENKTQVLCKSSRHFNCWVISSPSSGTPGPISDTIMTVHRMWKDVFWQKTKENGAFPNYNCMLQQLTNTSKRQYLLSCALYPNSIKFSLFYLLAYRKHSASFF